MIFGYAPGDQIVGQAMANTMINDGKQALLSISRSDAVSLGLQAGVTNHFSSLGGSVYLEGVFDGTTTDFASVLNDALTLSSYDIFHVMALMILYKYGIPQGPIALQEEFLNRSISFKDITGTIMLNENGDRSSGTFDYWGVENNNGVYQWYFKGKSERK